MTAPQGRLRLADALALSAIGLRARRVRSALSALGIAIAIAALVAVLGIASRPRRICSRGWGRRATC